jgi:alkylation response protein AidB-like acyl-CoA dehydrogenase
VAEELGRGVCGGPFLPVNVFGFAVSTFGTDDQRAMLPGLVAGELIGAWCLGGADGSWSGDALSAEPAAAGAYVLSGTSSYVQDAANADVLLVTAGGADGVSQFLVPTGTAGVTVTPLGTLDLSRRLAEVRFDKVAVDHSSLLGEFGRAAVAVERQRQVALVLQCAETVGVADHVLDFTVQYAKDRMAFGRPIGSYQALKHRFADHAMWLEASKATSSYAAHAVQEQREDAAMAVSVAKAHVARTATATVHDCIQMHGGIGMTWEHDIHLYMRRAVSNEALFGTPQEHCQRLCDLAGI